MKLKKAYIGAKVFSFAHYTHISKNMQETLKICMYTCRIIILMLFFLNIPYYVFGITFDEKAMKMYLKLMPFAKWGIVLKGFFEVMNAVMTGDVNAAKKNFIGYIVAFFILLALPSSMNEVQAFWMDGGGLE